MERREDVEIKGREVGLDWEALVFLGGNWIRSCGGSSLSSFVAEDDDVFVLFCVV